MGVVSVNSPGLTTGPWQKCEKELCILYNMYIQPTQHIVIQPSKPGYTCRAHVHLRLIGTYMHVPRGMQLSPQ